MREKGTWEIVERPSKIKVVGSKWVYKLKWSPNKSEVKFKSRLVAQGFSQEYGVNYYETYSPVVKNSAVRMLLAVAVKCKLKVEQIDIKNAYVNSDLKEDVYVEQPQGFESGDRSKYVLKLKKSLYGLKQSGAVWNKCLNELLVHKLKFKRAKTDPCVYIRGSKMNEIVILAVYVDDVLIFSRNQIEIDRIKSEINNAFEIDNIGDVKKVIGMEVSCEGDKIRIYQRSMITDLLKCANMNECNSVKSPMEPALKLEKCNGNCSMEERVDGTEFRSIIGKLNYVASTTRPDLTFSVSFLSQFNLCPHKEHMMAVKRVLRYLKGTTTFGIEYVADEPSLEAYADADWAGCVVDRRSYTGYVILMSGGAVAWEAKKQPTVALSSTEAEYMALTSAIKEVKYLANLMDELGLSTTFGLNTPILYCDNKGAICIAENQGYSARTKHIDVRHHFIREAIEMKIIKLEYVASSENYADIFTKSLGHIIFNKLKDGVIKSIHN